MLEIDKLRLFIQVLNLLQFRAACSSLLYKASALHILIAFGDNIVTVALKYSILQRSLVKVADAQIFNPLECLFKVISHLASLWEDVSARKGVDRR